MSSTQADGEYLVWSIEHRAWWRPGRCGYTCQLARAGRYSYDDAKAIVVDANIVSFNECMIPLKCVEPVGLTVCPECGEVTCDPACSRAGQR